MLMELSARNFKCWKDINEMRFAPITGLFGTNSSGKTSILQLLLMIKQTIESSDRAAVLEFGDERSLTNLGSFPNVIFGHNQSNPLHFIFAWRQERDVTVRDPARKKGVLFSGKELGFECSIAGTAKNKLVVDRFAYSLGDSVFLVNRKNTTGSEYELDSTAGDFRFVRTQGRPWPLPGPVKFYGFPDQVFAYYQNAGFLADLQLALEEFFNNVYYLGPLREFPQRHYAWKGSEPADMGRKGERVVDALLASRHRGKYISPGFRRPHQTLEQRVAHWLKHLDLIHGFSVEAIAEGSNLYQVLVQKAPSSAKVSITDVGFGVSQVLPVLTLCYHVPKGSTILLEQPELHLHPSVQSGLADVLIDAMQNRGVQIILESHSEYLLRRFQRRIAEGGLDPKKTALYFCGVSKVGSTLTALQTDLFGNITNWPDGFFGDEFGEIAAMAKAVAKRKKAMKR